MMAQMLVFVDWLITILVVALVTAHIGYLISLRSQPTGRRPRTWRYDRFGERLDAVENPDYHVIPVEDDDDKADLNLPATEHQAGR